ncbi:SUMF1/EgtB/PvdO family nonheme iron enzyme [uncultured Ruegeria sp.]|uniref:formylglycine-generating enzyme family protein n=1 Tax=uncultured Ruegeria sp. TaxID=259304 RepID=UPI00260E873B|nr:SUMF1/EgtB/PvdO family nonheme iron enzyme [uncultured Ruegeria sp.]
MIDLRRLWPVLLLCLTGGAAWAQVAGEVFADCDGCPEMILLDDGTAIGATLVTRAQFADFAAESELPGTESCFIRIAKRWKNTPGKGWSDPGFEQGPDHPAVCINWLEATAYADWLSDKTGQYYRLPTFEESMATTAAGADTAYWWGDDFSEVCSRANAADANFKAAFPEDGRKILACDDGYAYTSPVKAYPPNPLGLYDAVGNVWQWTNTCLKGDCSNALFRGASWVVPAQNHFRNDGQWADRIILRNSAVGFRVLRDVQ